MQNLSDRFQRRWYAHTDRWKVVYETNHFMDDVKAVVHPKYVDLAFGSQVEIRIRESDYEIFACSGEDDGRYTVRVDRETLISILEVLELFTSGKSRLGEIDIRLKRLGMPRSLSDDEATFLSRAISEIQKRHP